MCGYYLASPLSDNEIYEGELYVSEIKKISSR